MSGFLQPTYLRSESGFAKIAYDFYKLYAFEKGNDVRKS